MDCEKHGRSSFFTEPFPLGSGLRVFKMKCYECEKEKAQKDLIKEAVREVLQEIVEA